MGKLHIPNGSNKTRLEKPTKETPTSSTSSGMSPHIDVGDVKPRHIDRSPQQQAPDLSVVSTEIIPNLRVSQQEPIRGNLKDDINKNGNDDKKNKNKDKDDKKRKNKKDPKNRAKNWFKKQALKTLVTNLIPIATAIGSISAVGSCSAAMFTGSGNDNTVIEQDRGQDKKYSVGEIQCYDTKSNDNSDISATRQKILDWCSNHLGIPYSHSGWGESTDNITYCTCTSFAALAYKLGADLNIGSGDVVNDMRAGDPEVFLNQIKDAGNWHDYNGDVSVFKPGDIIVYGQCQSGDSRPYQHVAVYAGDGQVYQEITGGSQKGAIDYVDNCVGGGWPLSTSDGGSGSGSTSSSSSSSSSGSSSSNDSSSSNRNATYNDPVINGKHVCGDTSVGEEIAELAVQCALNTLPEARVHAPHDWPYPDVYRDQFDSRAKNQIAICDATLGKYGGNAAVASCTQCAATIIAAVADPDMCGTYNGIMASAGPGDGGNGFLPYLLMRTDLYKEVSVTTSTIKPGDILCNSHHDAIWVGNKAAKVKFSDTTGNVYEGGYNDGWTPTPTGDYSETLTTGGTTYYNCGAEAYLPILNEYDDPNLADYRVFRITKKNPNPKNGDFVDWRSLIGDSTTAGGDGGTDEHSEAIVNACKSTPSPGSGLCAQWVSDVYEKAGLPRPGGNGNSILNNSTTTSTDWSKIKAGQILSCKQTSTDLGKIYGHTAIYIGNGQVMDNIGYIRTESLTDWLNEYQGYNQNGGWVKYGWPW